MILLLTSGCMCLASLADFGFVRLCLKFMGHVGVISGSCIWPILFLPYRDIMYRIGSHLRKVPLSLSLPIDYHCLRAAWRP